MGRREESIVFVDTHIAIWLYNGESEKFSPNTRLLINSSAVLLTPILFLEIEYLYEINRLKDSTDKIFQYLEKQFDTKMSTSLYPSIIDSARKINWTRDVFDRLIVADAAMNNAKLITADKLILKNYKNAVHP